MPAKHSAPTFGTARVVLSAAVAVLMLLVVWIAMRAVGPAEASRQPTVVLPSMPQVEVPAPSPSPSPTPTPTPTPTSAAPSSRAATSPAPSKTRTTTRPPARATTPAAPRPKAAATLQVGASWGGGYVAGVRVTNTGTAPLQWRVTVTHDDRTDLRLRGVRGATGSQDGDTLTFRGGPLAPGASAEFGYQVAGARRDEGRGDARPSGCSVVGGRCGMR